MGKYSFTSADKLLKICKSEGLSIGKVVIKNSSQERSISEDDLLVEMNKRLNVIRDAIKKGLRISKRTPSGLSGGDAKKLNKYKKTNILLGKTVFKAIKYSFAIMEHNARFGRIVAFPTAGSAGTVPGSLLSTKEFLKLPEEKLILAMFTAAGVGMITGENAMLAGAMGGCQAEVGTASAMAAASITELRGGSPEQAMNAAAISLKGLLGLVCDPIGGLVEAPCVKRNATAIANAFMASEISMAGIESNVPYDEVVVAMSNIAKLMADELKETAKGGLAITKTGQKVWQKVNCSL